MNNRKYIVLQCYHVNVLTLSSPRQAKRYPANLFSCENRVYTTPDNKSNDILAHQTYQRSLIFLFTKILNIHEAYVHITRYLQNILRNIIFIILNHKFVNSKLTIRHV